MALRSKFVFFARSNMTMVKVIRLPQRVEEYISTVEDGFLRALDTQDVTLVAQTHISEDETIVFMNGYNDNYIAIKMDCSVEPVDLTLREFNLHYPLTLPSFITV